MKSESDKLHGHIEIKRNVHLNFSKLDIDHLVEMLLYSKYYLQAGKAANRIVSALTDLCTWHIFLFDYELKLKHYSECYSKTVTPDGPIIFCHKLKHIFNFYVTRLGLQMLVCLPLWVWAAT